MVTSILFVHSPLVGPSTWATSAELMASRGFRVCVPDLTVVARASAPMWEVLVDTAVAGAATLAGDVGIVGHSGAGAFLPAIAKRVEGQAVSLLFVDAVLPPSSGVHETPAGLRALLDKHTVEGRLRRWLEWWPDDVVSELVPDVEERAVLLDDMPSLPRSFYDESVPVPERWTDRRCAYLKLSDAYDDEFADAGRRGWKREDLDADHLAIRTQPDRVVAAMESLLDDSS
jgi:hypothetical protein